MSLPIDSILRRALAAASVLFALACSSGTIDDPAGNGEADGDPIGSDGGRSDSRVVPGTDSGRPGSDTGTPGTDTGTTPTDTATSDLCTGHADGDWCGGTIGGDGATLYHCKGNAIASTEVCKDGCVDKTGPAGDACLSDSVDPCFNDGDGAYCGDSIGGPAGKVYHCKGKRTDSIEDCPDGCSHNPPGVPDTCAGALSCANVQWWNSALTYGPYMTGGWWDTDLAVSSGTKVQLRHDSKLDKTGVYAWGYMPEFTDQVTGKRFRILHLRPANQWATAVGTVYPAGFIVGLSGGDTADTGLGPYSTGAHLCIQTLEAYRTVFPTGKDPCK